MTEDLTKQVLAEKWVCQADPAPGSSQRVLVARGPRDVGAARDEVFGSTIEIEWGQPAGLAAIRARIASCAPEALALMLDLRELLVDHGCAPPENTIARVNAILRKAGLR